MSPHRSDETRRRHPSSHAALAEQFAHPSERDVAALLNLYGIAWAYEPVEFPLDVDESGRVTRAFRPDFYLPEFDVYLEVTVLEQRLVTRKNRKVRDVRDRYPGVEIDVLYRRQVLDLLERHGLGVLAAGESSAA